MSRKPLSVVKNVLNRNCSHYNPPAGVTVTPDTKDNWCDWAPFNGDNSEELLGTLDSSFLFAYAFAMFFSGYIAERVNLRYFLSIGMLLSGIFTYLFGIAYSYGIHHLWYFLFIQIIGGIVQSTGWPSVVTCIGNWFGKGRRGLIFGIWNSHTSVGNILGSVIAGAFVDYNWGMSFIVPGAITGVMGFLTFLYLVVYPEDVGCTSPDHHGSKNIGHVAACKNYKSDSSNDDEICVNSSVEVIPEDERPILPDGKPANGAYSKNSEDLKAVSLSQALKIPGVIEFSLCLFFAKLVSYTFLYWLPRYIKVSTSFSATDSANLSTLFDVGGILGGIIAGVISDNTGASATTCTVMLLVAIPMLFVYEMFGNISLACNIVLLMICGLLVNGPYALITTAVSAELGTHRSLKGNSKALATVASLIDGTGSLGAAVGPLFAGLIASSGSGWSSVFYMLMAADVLAMLLLTRQVRKEMFRIGRNMRDKRRQEIA